MNPGAHASHVGCLLVVPATAVYLPGGHLVWVMQEPASFSVTVLFVELPVLMYPGLHGSHSGWVVLVSATVGQVAPKVATAPNSVSTRSAKIQISII